MGGFGPSPNGAHRLRQNPKSTILVDNIPYVWYNGGMKKMSDMSQINKMRYFMSGMSDFLFLPRHYEGVGENQGKFFARHYEGSEKNQGDFLFEKKHYESNKISQGTFTKGNK